MAIRRTSSAVNTLVSRVEIDERPPVGVTNDAAARHRVGAPWWGTGASPFGALVNPCAFQPDLDLPAVDVAYDPTPFQHNPRHRKRGVGTSALSDFHTVDKDKYVIVVILVNRANGVFHAHGSSTSDSSW
jgi:hypothetical protein